MKERIYYVHVTPHFRASRLWFVLVAVCLLVGGLGGGFLLGRQTGFDKGWAVGVDSHQNVNDLISVGFIVVDPDGYECDKFDEDFRRDAGQRRSPTGYYTTTPKPK